MRISFACSFNLFPCCPGPPVRAIRGIEPIPERVPRALKQVPGERENHSGEPVGRDAE